MKLVPIHELLNRIAGEPEFARGSFQLGHCDRAEDRVVLVPLKEVRFPAESSQTFQRTDAEGQHHRIPFHRVQNLFHAPPACALSVSMFLVEPSPCGHPAIPGISC